MVQVIIWIGNNMTVVDINNTNYDLSIFQHPFYIALYNTRQYNYFDIQVCSYTTTKHSSRS